MRFSASGTPRASHKTDAFILFRTEGTRRLATLPDKALLTAARAAVRAGEFSGKPSETLLRMARVPAGSQLLDTGDLWFPLVVMHNVYIFPGVPELLRKKFEDARERFRGVPFVLKKVYVRERESDVAPVLNELLQEFPRLMLGSYPRIGQESFQVMLTLESRDAGYVQKALDALLVKLDTKSVHRVE